MMTYPTIKHPLICLGLLACMPIRAMAADPATYTHVVFTDDFSAPEVKKEWKFYKTESVVKNGVLIGGMPEGPGHPAGHSIHLSPTAADLEVAVSFRFEGAERFAVNFYDTAYKGAFAGHIAGVGVTPGKLSIADHKAGIFKTEIWAMKEKDAATVALLQTKTKEFALSLTEKTWHKLLIRLRGDEIVVAIDGQEVGRFSSEGIAHSIKDKLSLVVPGRWMHFDDVSIRTP